MAKVAFIIDDSIQYLSSKVKEIMNDWSIPPSEYKTITEWKIGIAKTRTMFGEPKAIHLDLTTKDNFNKFINLLKTDKKFSSSFKSSDWFGRGVVITTTYAQGSKPIEKIILEQKGIFIKKRSPEELKEELLDKLNINKSLKNFLSEYTGQDYSILLNCINTINSLTVEEQQNLTTDDLIIYLPFKKGSIPPWEFVNELMKLNGNLAFDKLKRTLEHQHPLLVLTFLKRKIDELYYNKILIESGITSFQDRAKIIKANQWSIKNITNLTNKVSLSVLEYLVYYVYNVEDNFKGNGIVSDEKTYLENVIGNIYVSLRYNIKGGNQ